ncbi:unnamed protein product, partial [Discosporangium mesarthrocarpum]
MLSQKLRMRDAFGTLVGRTGPHLPQQLRIRMRCPAGGIGSLPLTILRCRTPVAGDAVDMGRTVGEDAAREDESAFGMGIGRRRGNQGWGQGSVEYSSAQTAFSSVRGGAGHRGDGEGGAGTGREEGN